MRWPADETAGRKSERDIDIHAYSPNRARRFHRQGMRRESVIDYTANKGSQQVMDDFNPANKKSGPTARNSTGYMEPCMLGRIL